MPVVLRVLLYCQKIVVQPQNNILHLSLQFPIDSPNQRGLNYSTPLPQEPTCHLATNNDITVNMRPSCRLRSAALTDPSKAFLVHQSPFREALSRPAKAFLRAAMPCLLQYFQASLTLFNSAVMALGLFLAAEARTFRAARLVTGSAHTGRSTDIPRPRCSGIVNRKPVNILPTKSYTARRGGGGGGGGGGWGA